MELIQKQVQRLNQQMLQRVELLQMSALELEAYLRELEQENPVVELETAEMPLTTSRDEELILRLRWLEDNDYQNRYYQPAAEELDPVERIGNAGGLEETLERFLNRQLDRMKLDRELDRAARCLAACLDRSGYLRITLEELSGPFQMPVSCLERALNLLQSLEPAGVGAADLAQCLELQLQRIGYGGAALAIVRGHLDLLAKRHYRAIAEKLSVSMDEIRWAEAVIRELDPRPGSIFDEPEQTVYIQADVFVVKEDGMFVVRTKKKERAAFRISGEYRTLLNESDDPEVRSYLKEKLRQAEWVLTAISQREETLLRCARAIVARQQDFFRLGPVGMKPLRLADVAEEVGIHESTVSRAIREKYLQCAKGVYPLRYFLSRGIAAEQEGAGEAGTEAAKELLRTLIDVEDKMHPLSDQKLCEEMARQGCAISRRTVAKYRVELGIPSAGGRKTLWL